MHRGLRLSCSRLFQAIPIGDWRIQRGDTERLHGAQPRRPSSPKSCRLTPSTSTRPGEVWGCCLHKGPADSLPTPTAREHGWGSLGLVFLCVSH